MSSTSWADTVEREDRKSAILKKRADRKAMKQKAIENRNVKTEQSFAKNTVGVGKEKTTKFGFQGISKNVVPYHHMQRLLTYGQEHKMLNASRRSRGEKEIPFVMAQFFKGTQNPVFLLRDASSITTVTTTLYNTVIAINASAFNQFADFANLFDEYRPVWGKVHFRGRLNNGWNGTNADQKSQFGFGVIDYADATAITTHSAVVGYDTHKPFACDARSEFAKQTWTIQFEPLPDQDWIPITTQSTNFCWWKPVILAADITIGQANAASVEYEVAFQMRAII
jgi:hypothetical protein